jgi:hypothetical protein
MNAYVCMFSNPAELKIRFLLETAPNLLFDLLGDEDWDALISTLDMLRFLLAYNIPISVATSNNIGAKFIRDLDVARWKLTYSIHMAACHASGQTLAVGALNRLACWNAERKNRDLGTAPQGWQDPCGAWFHQVCSHCFECVYSMTCLLPQYSREMHTLWWTGGFDALLVRHLPPPLPGPGPPLLAHVLLRQHDKGCPIKSLSAFQLPYDLQPAGTDSLFDSIKSILSVRFPAPPASFDEEGDPIIDPMPLSDTAVLHWNVKKGGMWIRGIHETLSGRGKKAKKKRKTSQLGDVVLLHDGRFAHVHSMIEVTWRHQPITLAFVQHYHNAPVRCFVHILLLFSSGLYLFFSSVR